MYNKRVITADTIMGMTPNMCVKLFQEQQREIERLSRLVEKQGKKCNKYQRLLAAAHFGGEDKIPRKSAKHGAGPRIFAGWRHLGFYAYMADNDLVIEYRAYNRGMLLGKELYRGEYKGEETPYLNRIKQENVRMYNSIVKFFENK